MNRQRAFVIVGLGVLLALGAVGVYRFQAKEKAKQVEVEERVSTNRKAAEGARQLPDGVTQAFTKQEALARAQEAMERVEKELASAATLLPYANRFPRIARRGVPWVRILHRRVRP